MNTHLRVVFVPIGVDIGHLGPDSEVVEKALSLHRAGELDGDSSVGGDSLCSVLGGDADNARLVDGCESPVRRFLDARIASFGSRTGRDLGAIVVAPRQRLCRYKDHGFRRGIRLAATPAEAAGHRHVSSLERKGVLDRFMVHGLVKCHTDNIGRPDVLEAVGRLEIQDRGPDGDKLPGVVLVQHATGRIGEAGRDTGLVASSR